MPRDSPVTVLNFPMPAERRLIFSRTRAGTAWDLWETHGRIYDLFQRGYYPLQYYSPCSSILSDLRWTRSLDWGQRLPNLQNGDWIPMEDWFYIHGVRAHIINIDDDEENQDPAEDFENEFDLNEDNLFYGFDAEMIEEAIRAMETAEVMVNFNNDVNEEEEYPNVPTPNTPPSQ